MQFLVYIQSNVLTGIFFTSIKRRTPVILVGIWGSSDCVGVSRYMLVGTPVLAAQ